MLFNHITELIVGWGDKFIILIEKFSFETCMIVGLVALILSIFGYKKGKHIALISPAVYVIIQIFMEVWFGV